MQEIPGVSFAGQAKRLIYHWITNQKVQRKNNASEKLEVTFRWEE